MVARIHSTAQLRRHADKLMPAVEAATTTYRHQLRCPCCGAAVKVDQYGNLTEVEVVKTPPETRG